MGTQIESYQGQQLLLCVNVLEPGWSCRVPGQSQSWHKEEWKTGKVQSDTPTPIPRQTHTKEKAWSVNAFTKDLYQTWKDQVMPTWYNLFQKIEKG